MSILAKIKYKLKLIFEAKLIKFSLHLNCPWLTAKFLQMIAGKIQPANPKASEQKKYIVLCLARSIFMNDIDAMAKYNGRIKYY